MFKKELKYEIKKTLFTVDIGRGWVLELNLMSWNDRDPVYDLRKWSSEHNKMGKGVTMSEGELMEIMSHSGDIIDSIGKGQICDKDIPTDELKVEDTKGRDEEKKVEDNREVITDEIPFN